MKTVKSSEALKGLALTRGASASFGGGKFNSTGEKVKPSKPEPTPKPEPIPEPKAEIKQEPILPALKEVLTSIDGFAASTLKIEQSNQAVMVEIQKAVERMSIAPETPKPEPQKWKLVVNRDTRGVLQSIDVSKG